MPQSQLPSSSDATGHEVAGSPAHANVATGNSASKAELLPEDRSRADRRQPWLEAEPLKPGFSLAFLGVLLPLFTLCFEFYTRLCATSWFDPFPTWFHVFLVALVPVSNFLILLTRWSNKTQHRIRMAHLNAVAIGVTAAYGIAFLPYFPMSLMGLVVLGMGLMPLTPYFAGSATASARKWLSHWGRSRGEEPVKLPAARRIVVAVVTVLALPVIHHGATRMALNMAANGSPSSRSTAISYLRLFGNESTMLSACYASNRSMGMFSGLLGDSSISLEKAQEIFFQTTGVAFNTLPAPREANSPGFDGMRGWNFDAARGGDHVANKIDGLTMDYSQLEGRADVATLSSYTEWTMVFKNSSMAAEEARAQIELPAGAVVSRLTLWIDGEPREAAFGGRSQVKAAYREVAVVQQRDPVLVTTCGPDRVLMQCFPVPARNGEMKVRLGITGPLRVTSEKTVAMDWPRLLETNFESGNALRHVAWIESSVPINGGTNTFRQEMNDADFAKAGSLQMAAPALASETLFQDSSDPAFAIQQRVQKLTIPKDSRLFVVIDGSAGVKPHGDAIAKSLASARNIASVIFAGDEPQRWDGASPLGEWVNDRKFRGGCDNVPALAQAWDESVASPGASLLWIHGTQPILLSRVEALALRLKRAGVKTSLHDLPVAIGPNRVLAELDGAAEWARVGAGSSVEEKLGNFLADRWVVTRERIERPENATVTPVPNRDLLRLWGRDEIERVRHNPAQREQAVKLAQKLQLVTPVSGAVVLERKEQYDRHGLQPADPATVPAVPEPASATLLALATAGLLARRRRSGRHMDDKPRA